MALAQQVVTAAGAEADLLRLEQSAPVDVGAVHNRWLAADGAVIVTSTRGGWPGALALLLDELARLEGRGPRMHGAGAHEEPGSAEPRATLAGRACGLIVHGDAAAIESDRRQLADALEDIGLVQAHRFTGLMRYIVDYGPHFNRCDAVDAEKMVEEEARNVARSVLEAVAERRAGRQAVARRRDAAASRRGRRLGY